MASSRPENATIKAKGIRPKKKNTKPEVIMLNTKPLKIFNNMWPLKIFAANLRPRETFLAKYDMNSIITRRGNNPNGQPAGTKREKKFKPCFWNPSIVAPKTTVKLSEKVNMKWEVEAKL